MQKYIYLLAFAGLSGVINAIFVMTDIRDLYVFHVTLGAGILYGLVTGFYFFTQIRISFALLRYALWIIISGLSYYVAVMTTLNSTVRGYFPDLGFEDYVMGGLVGSIIVALGFALLYRRLSLLNAVILVMLGGAIPQLIMLYIDFDTKLYMPVLYLVWQTTITFVLGYQVPESVSKAPTRTLSKKPRVVG